MDFYALYTFANVTSVGMPALFLLHVREFWQCFNFSSDVFKPMKFPDRVGYSCSVIVLFIRLLLLNDTLLYFSFTYYPLSVCGQKLSIESLI